MLLLNYSKIEGHGIHIKKSPVGFFGEFETVVNPVLDFIAFEWYEETDETAFVLEKHYFTLSSEILVNS